MASPCLASASRRSSVAPVFNAAPVSGRQLSTKFLSSSARLRLVSASIPAIRRLCSKEESESIITGHVSTYSKALESPETFLSCGESGIRTHGTVSRTRAFQARPLSHSGTSPCCKDYSSLPRCPIRMKTPEIFPTKYSGPETGGEKISLNTCFGAKVF